RIWGQLRDERSRNAVEVAERYADGMVDNEQLGVARKGAERVLSNPWVYREFETGAKAASQVADQVLYLRASDYAGTAARYDAFDRVVSSGGRRLPPGIREAELTAQTDLIRCLIGDPFHNIAIAPSWLAWNGGSVRKLAQVIYDERRFEDLPILAD